VVLGISVDSVHAHANWAASLGGISFPLLADFHPKGAAAKAYGLYLEEKGITDRATVIVDAGGTIRHISSVTPAGERDIDALLTLCQRIRAGYPVPVQSLARPAGVESGTELFVKSNCGFSRATLLARDNLHAQGRVAVHNVSEDAKAKDRLRALTGKEQAPCLVAGGKPLLESADIVRHLVTQATGYWS
jgi:glutaredoxin